MFPHSKKKYLLAVSIAVVLLLSAPVLALAVSDWNGSPVIADSYDQVNASISGSVVVWQDYRNKQQVPPNTGTGCPGAQNCTAADIYALDLNSGVERRLTTTYNGLDPDISGGLVAWRDWDTGRIVVYDLAAGTRRDASTAATQMVTPSISGNRVVWTDYRNSIDYGDIYMRDLTQPTETYVSRGSDLPAGKVSAQKDKRNPEIDGDIVVWEDMRNAYQDAQGWWHNPDIYMKNLATGVETAVCTNIYDQYNPVVSGNRVYWMDYRYGNWDVYMKDLGTGIETRLTVNNAHQSWPSASGDIVAWKDAREGDEDIYMRNLAGGVEQRVNADPDLIPAAGQKIPVADGLRIAWMDRRAGNWDIYSARDEAGPQVTAITPSGPVPSNALSVSALYSDGGTGVDTSTVAVAVDGLQVAGCTATATRVDCPSAVYQDGSHSVSVSMSDHSGNLSAPAEAQFTVDTAAPVITNPVPEGTVLGDTMLVSAAFSDPLPSSGIDTATVSLTVDGAAVPGCDITGASLSCTLAGVADGSHLLRAAVTDNAGNTGSLFWSITVNGGPDVTGLLPAAGAVVNNPTTAIEAKWSDTGDGVDDASVRVYLDGAAMQPPGISLNAGDFSYQPAWGSRLADGLHVARVVVADQLGIVTDHTWSFTITSPAAADAVASIYWDSYASYLRRELSVEFQLTATGTGSCNDAMIVAGTATSGVSPTGFPLSLGNIASGEAAAFTLRYSVPVDVASFVAGNYSSCADDGGNIYWSPDSPPA